MATGFTKATDRRRIYLLLESAKRYGYCMPDLPTVENYVMPQTINCLTKLFQTATTL